MSSTQDTEQLQPWPRRRVGWWRIPWLCTRVYVLLLLVLMLFENKLIFPAPRFPQGDWSPPNLEAEDVYFSAVDGTALHGWYLDHPEPKGYVLYCHGNGEHVAYLAPLLKQLHDEFDLAVFAFDYRGYGRSQGAPNEAGVLLDADAAHDWLVERAGIQPDDMLLFGRSIGGAIAVDLASKRGARGLVLESTFTSMPDVAARLFWWAPVRLLMRTQFDSESKIVSYRGPLLQSHGTADSLVPIELAKRLFDAASTAQTKRFVAMPGLGHNDWPSPEYYVELRNFLDRLPSAPTSGPAPF